MFWRRLGYLVLLLAVGLIGERALAQEPKPTENKPATAPPPAKPVQRPEELKVLDRLTGVWLVEASSSTMSDAGDGKVDTQRGKTIETMQWALENSFIAGHSAGETGKIISAWMWGYDQATKTYRLWWFGAGGQMTEWAGAYDAGNQTFTLRTQTAGGYKSTATIQFIDDNSRKQVVELRDPAGKLTQRITAMMTRKK
jgi:hypothetical protein